MRKLNFKSSLATSLNLKKKRQTKLLTSTVSKLWKTKATIVLTNSQKPNVNWCLNSNQDDGNTTRTEDFSTVTELEKTPQ